jgi:hypothetical protein
MYDFESLFLSQPLSATSDADPDDVLSTKSALKQLGYYETPSYGLTPYPDQPLFDGIRAYQKDKGLTVDGYMLPNGETEQSVNLSLATSPRDGENAEAACADPAVYRLPGWLGGSQGRNYCPIPREKANNEDCERQRENDEDECRDIKERYGSYRAQRCWASSNLRYANCLRGQLNFPPLDRGYP